MWSNERNTTVVFMFSYDVFFELYIKVVYYHCSFVTDTVVI